MLRLCALMGFYSLIAVSIAAAQEKGNSLHEFLEPTSTPNGYQAVVQDLKDKEKVIGHMIMVTKPDQVSKVVIRIDLSDRTETPSRRAAAKAYVNGFASSIANQGFKVVSKKLPDLEKEQFEKPIQVELGFKNDDGIEIFSFQKIFFTDKGFVVQVIANDAEDLDVLTKWAKSIKPKKEEK